MQHRHLRLADAPAEAPALPRTGHNERIKALLRSFGLRTSLIRLKVIEALYEAACENRSLGVRGLHSQLGQTMDIPLSFLSVREVLRRLESDGVVHLGTDKSYQLEPRAWATLAAAS